MATVLTEINSLGDNNTLARARHTEETGRFQTPWTISLFSNLPQPSASIKVPCAGLGAGAGPITSFPTPRQAGGGRWEGTAGGAGEDKSDQKRRNLWV